MDHPDPHHLGDCACCALYDSEPEPFISQEEADDLAWSMYCWGCLSGVVAVVLPIAMALWVMG